MAQVPERYATPLSLRYFEGMSYGEISRVLGKKEVTIRSLVHRGLKKMRRVLDSGDATHPWPGH